MIVHYKHSGGAGPEDALGREAFVLAEQRGDVCGPYGSRRGIRCAGRTSGCILLIEADLEDH